MLQRYHLVLRRPDRALVMAECRSLGWLLPIATADARPRASHVVSQLVERLNVDAAIVCVTSGMVDRQATAIDWLAVADVRAGRAPGTLTERAVGDLLESRPVVQVQTALLRAYQRLLEIPDSALSRDWLAGATAWAARSLSSLDWGEAFDFTSHRADLFEAVLELRRPRACLEHEGSSRAFFLKWRARGPFMDPDVAKIVAAAGETLAPNTLAHDRARGRWLTQAVRGVRLAADLSALNVRRAAATMAQAQMKLLPVVGELRSIGVCDESLVDIAAEADRILDRLPSAVDRHDVRAASAAIHRACSDLDAPRLPATWIHTDFVPENVFVDDGRVSFIDFDDPWIGPPPVAMELLFSGLRRHLRDPAERSEAICCARESFVQAWRPVVAPEAMHRAFRSTRLVAEVLRISRRLRSIAVREQNGELEGFLDPAARESAARLVALATKPAH